MGLFVERPKFGKWKRDFYMIKFTDKLTIAIPVFERKDFFLEAILSVLNQTIKCDIIVVDNNSSHDFFEITCRHYNIKYFKNDLNIGMFPNWNKCFELAYSDFVMILGDDDILDEKYVESFIEAYSNHSDIDVFFTDFIKYDNTNKTFSKHNHILPFGYMPNGSKVIEYGIKYRLGFPIITSTIKKSKFAGFYNDFHASNDWVWLYENADNLVFYGLNKKLLKYRYHGSNDSRNEKTRLNCFISIWYIYGEVFKLKYSHVNALKKYYNKNLLYNKFYVISNISKNHLAEISSLSNKYACFFNKELNNNKILASYLHIPAIIRKFVFKICIKLNIIS